MATDAVTVVVTRVLLNLPSLTTKLATYTPTRSAVKVGLAEVLSFKAAALPMGLASKVQL